MIRRVFIEYPALKNRQFVFLALGFAMSTIGSRFNQIALNLLIFQKTQSIGLISAIWIVRTITRLVLQPYFGVIVDRFDRYKLIVISQILNALTAFCFIFISDQTPVLLFILVFLFQAVDGISGPALGSVFPQIVNEEELVSANSFASMIDKTASALGFALGAILFSHFGATMLFIIDSLSYLVALLVVLPLRKYIPVIVQSSKPKYWFNDAVAGLQIIWSQKAVFGVFIIIFTNSLVWRLFEVLIVPVASQTQFGEAGLGYIFSSLTVGGFIGAFIAPRIIKWLGEYSIWAMFLTFGLTALPLSLFGAFDDGYIYLAAMVVSGILLDVVGIYSRSLIQKVVANDVLGRVFAFQNVAIALGGLPALLSLNTVTQKVGFQIPFFICSGIIVFVTLSSTFLLNRYRPDNSRDVNEVKDAPV